MIKWLTYTRMQVTLAALLVGVDAAILNLLAGAVAGAVAATAVTPFDVIKTRLQAPRGNPVAERPSALRVLRELLAEGGLPELFRGLGPRLMRIPMYTAVTLATFDLVKDCFAAANVAASARVDRVEL